MESVSEDFYSAAEDQQTITTLPARLVLGHVSTNACFLALLSKGGSSGCLQLLNGSVKCLLPERQS